MAFELDEIEILYAEGDPWQPPDADTMPSASDAYQETWERAHRADGSHRPPVPQAWASYAFAAGIYSREFGEGVTVTRIGVGRMQVTLDQAMAGPDAWIAVVTPLGSEFCGAYEDTSAAKTSTTSVVQMVNQNGLAQDVGFLVEVFGDRS